MRQGSYLFITVHRMILNEVQVDEPGYSWVNRHTWQSWRERYKKNAARLDVAIANIVSQRPVIPGEKGQYGYVRLVEDRGKKPKKASKPGTPILLDLHGASGSTYSSVQTSASAAGELMYSSLTTAYSAPPQSASIMIDNASRTATLTSLQESQEGSEWAIRIGDAPPPTWSKKRSLSQEDTLEDDHKRKRIDIGYVFWFRHPTPHLYLNVLCCPPVLYAVQSRARPSGQ